jgi:hypothetical protein
MLWFAAEVCSLKSSRMLPVRKSQRTVSHAASEGATCAALKASALHITESLRVRSTMHVVCALFCAALPAIGAIASGDVLASAQARHSSAAEVTSHLKREQHCTVYKD